ncbi:MAG: hypothetical protein CMF23_07030 [Ignavibacteriae bacterium]|nr:hypothetical protein [Ignavibacteriota bacterium]
MKLKLITFFLIALTITMAQNKEISLKESIEIGIANSKELKLAKTKVELSKAKYEESGTYLLPTVRASAAYIRLSEVPPFEVTVPFSPTPIKIQEPVLNNYNLGLSVTQPIFTGFKLSSLKSAAEKTFEAEEISFNQEINNLALRINEAYWNLYKAEKYVLLLKENKKRIEEHLKNTEEFFNNELVTKNDLLKMKSQLANINYQLIEGKKNLETARMFFNKTIGISLEKQLTPTEEIEQTDYELKDISEYIKQADKQRNELKSAEKITEAGKNMISAANSDWFPTISIFGNYYYNRPNQRIMPTQDKFNDTWDVGVNLSWEIWNWGKTSFKAEQAEQQYKLSQLSLEILKENIQMEVYRNYLSVNAESEKLKSALQLLESTEENYRITKEKYNMQAATSTELLDAEVEFLEAQIKDANAKADYIIALKKLLVSSGEKIY